jgi:hypothetical protein
LRRARAGASAAVESAAHAPDQLVDGDPVIVVQVEAAAGLDRCLLESNGNSGHQLVDGRRAVVVAVGGADDLAERDDGDSVQSDQ